jgi:type VI secretion system ImpM family protein
VDPQAAAIGLWGKHPARPDFVRWRAGDVSRLGFDRWFEEAYEALRREGRALPSEPAAFFYPAGAEALVGAMVPSRDAVGREYPLLLVTTVRPAALATNFSLFPLACSRFLEAAERLLAGAAATPLETLMAHAEALDGQVWSGLGLQDLEAYLSGAELAELGPALGGIPDALPYALVTLRQACAQARDGGGAAVTVDAPAPTHAAAALWLELAHRGLEDRRAPLCFWIPAQGRLLMSLGKPSTQLLAFLANPAHASGTFWPLLTSVAAAKADAARALPRAQAALLSSSVATMADLLQTS